VTKAEVAPSCKNRLRIVFVLNSRNLFRQLLPLWRQLRLQQEMCSHCACGFWHRAHLLRGVFFVLVILCLEVLRSMSAGGVLFQMFLAVWPLMSAICIVENERALAQSSSS